MKKTIYFSDIMGTINGNSKNIEADYDKFNELLKRIKAQDESDEVVFSLISTDEARIVKGVQDTVRPYIQDTVTFGRQYFDKGYYTDDGSVTPLVASKATHIIDYLNGLLETDDDIASIYFVDDVEMYHVMLKHLINKGLADRLHTIIPIKKDGLSETNELLERLLESQKTNNKHL